MKSLVLLVVSLLIARWLKSREPSGRRQFSERPFARRSGEPTKVKAKGGKSVERGQIKAGTEGNRRVVRAQHCRLQRQGCGSNHVLAHRLTFTPSRQTGKQIPGLTWKLVPGFSSPGSTTSFLRNSKSAPSMYKAISRLPSNPEDRQDAAPSGRHASQSRSWGRAKGNLETDTAGLEAVHCG